MTRRPATDQELAAALTRLRVSAAQARTALRELAHLTSPFNLSMPYTDLAKADGILGKLAAIDHRQVAVERKPLKRRTKKPNEDATQGDTNEPRK